jgi:nitrate reductase assembly molybdenum cofactor insertion protein NarJ/Pyruvate/2-oxoacid:ferredoxin oxidoreductase delta subunit
LYQGLAEALAEPPSWLAGPGREWPLFELAVAAAPTSEAVRRAAVAMAEIPADSLAARRRRYRALFGGAGRPRFWLHESAYRSGRIYGQDTLAVAKVYEAVGLTVSDAELPDHASLELAFLAFVAGQQEKDPSNAGQWRQLERRFITRHAGRWLPQLGQALAAAGDAVYGPIGQLLAGWLPESGQRPRRQPVGGVSLPGISEPELCGLCGFCVQVCPTRALAIRETESETILVLAVPACLACGHCIAVCDGRALRLAPPGDQAEVADGRINLRRSPRHKCPGCRQPTVSQAELDYVARQIGQPAWLAYCLDCRSGSLEVYR